MATINCTEGWAARAYNSGWQSSNWQTDFTVQNSDGYCNSPSYSSTHGFVFRFKTPTISKFHQGTKLTITLPVMRQTENYSESGTLYFKLLTSDPTPANTTSGSLPDSLKITSSNCDASYSWGTWVDCHAHTISFTIEKTNLKSNTYYYIAVGGSQLLHIGVGWKGNSVDGYYGNFTPDTGHWKAELTYSTYTDATAPSITKLVDNGNNTVTLEVKQGTNGTNNKIESTTLSYTIDGGSAISLSITAKSEGTASYTIKVTKTCTIKVTIISDFPHNNNLSATKSVSAKYYHAPSTPGKPALMTDSFKNGRLTIRKPWTYAWTAATPYNTETHNVVKGYWIRIWRWSKSYSKNNGWQVVHSTQWEGSTTSYTFNPVNLGFVAKDRVQIEVAAYSINGKGEQLWSAQSNTYQYEHPSGKIETFELYTLSDISTVQNAGIVQIKVNNNWTEGQVWVKVNGSWIEAETVNTKVNGGWQESQ